MLFLLALVLFFTLLRFVLVLVVKMFRTVHHSGNKRFSGVFVTFSAYLATFFFRRRHFLVFVPRFTGNSSAVIKDSGGGSAALTTELPQFPCVSSTPDRALNQLNCIPAKRKFSRLSCRDSKPRIFFSWVNFYADSYFDIRSTAALPQ